MIDLRKNINPRTQPILQQHGVKTKVENKQLFALDEYTLNTVYGCDWINVTGYNIKQILNFLNY